MDSSVHRIGFVMFMRDRFCRARLLPEAGGSEPDSLFDELSGGILVAELSDLAMTRLYHHWQSIPRRRRVRSRERVRSV